MVRLVDDKTTFLPESSTDTTYKNETQINVDGWLQITKIFEYNGQLALVAENISDIDVEYALLTVKNKNDTFTFNISVLLPGTKGMLICNEAIGFDPDEIYTGWKIENIIEFETKPVQNDDIFELGVADGSILIKNISGKDITSDILIYYKEKNENFLNGNVTHRIRVSGLKADSQTFVKVDGINGNNCQIIFTEYDDKKV